jgi:hypothetical protein
LIVLDIIFPLIYVNFIGIERHRDATKLLGAVQHRLLMRDKGRVDGDGQPVDYSKEELRHILVERSIYTVGDFERIVQECVEKRGK